MDFDDLDSEEIPAKAPAKVSRFAPRGANKPKPIPTAKPKVEEPSGKPEPEQSSVVEDVKPSLTSILEPKAESFTSNGTAKMEVEVEDKLEDKPEPMDEDIDVGDEVVREIDVYFNPSVGANTQLYVMQYPLRPWWRPYELDERCEKVRVKPGSAEVEVDLSIDAGSNNFDADSNSKFNMKKQTLASRWKAPLVTSYAVGLLTGNKLHLNPVHAIVQLRPSMEHLKSDAASTKGNVSSSSAERVKKEESAESSKNQSKKLEHSNEEGVDEGEKWVPLVYHGSKSDLAGRYLQKLEAHESTPIQFTMNPFDYLHSLCPGAADSNRKAVGSLKRLLLSLPLEDRFKRLLCEAPQIHRFSALRHYAPDVSDEQILSVLQRNAHLVQGCWVPRSPLIFESASSQSFARDYTLLLFSKKSVIHSSVLQSKKKMIADAIKKFLSLFGIERPSLGDYKFKVPTDVSFLKKYPLIAKEQEQKWEDIEKNSIMPMLEKADKGNNANAARLKQSSMAASKEARSTANMDKAAAKSASGGGRRTMSDETREALPKALQKIFQNHKACSFELICESLRDLAVSQSSLPKADPRMAIAAAHGVDAPHAELKEVINTVATEIYGVYVSKSSPEHPEYDPLREVVIKLLIGKGPNASLKKAEIYEAAKKLKREISNNEYTKVMSELCESKGASWYLRKSN